MASLLVTPWQQPDPLGLANITRAGLQDAQRQQNINAQMDQQRAEVGLKLMAQTLSDVNENLWKKREMDRRTEMDKFNMSMDLKKLDLAEKEMEMKNKEFEFLHDPTQNPLLKSQIAENEAQAAAAQSKVLTPEEAAVAAAKKQADAQLAQTKAEQAARALNFDEATGLNKVASDVLTDFNKTDATFAPMTEQSSQTFRDAERIKAETDQAMKLNAPTPKPGTAKAPTGPKPLTPGQEDIIVNRRLTPVRKAIEDNQAALDKARTAQQRVEEERAKALADPVNAPMIAYDPKKYGPPVNKPFDEAKSKIMVSIVDESGNSRTVPIAEAEKILKKQRDDAKIKEVDIRNELKIAPAPAQEPNSLLPPPPARMPGEPAGPRDAAAPPEPSPLAPPVAEVLKGVSPAVQSKILPFLTGEPRT